MSKALTDDEMLTLHSHNALGHLSRQQLCVVAKYVESVEVEPSQPIDTSEPGLYMVSAGKAEVKGKYGMRMARYPGQSW